MFDLERLSECADPIDVAEGIGLETKRRGRHVFCECPSHQKNIGKRDNSIGNCILTSRGYHCFACGADGSVYDMVMDYKNVSFKKAAQIVASIVGGSFYTKNDESKPLKRSPFSQEDLELIGIKTATNPMGDAGREILGVSASRPEAGVFFRRGAEYVLYSTTQRITLNQLFEKDEKVYYALILDNAKKTLENYQRIMNAFKDRGNPEYFNILNVFSEMETSSKMVSEIKNTIAVNIKRVQRIAEEAEAKTK